MTGLFHGAAEAGRVRDACMTARSLVQIAGAGGKDRGCDPPPADGAGAIAIRFGRPDGPLPVVPLESAARSLPRPAATSPRRTQPRRQWPARVRPLLTTLYRSTKRTTRRTMSESLQTIAARLGLTLRVTADGSEIVIRRAGKELLRTRHKLAAESWDQRLLVGNLSRRPATLTAWAPTTPAKRPAGRGKRTTRRTHGAGRLIASGSCWPRPPPRRRWPAPREDADDDPRAHLTMAARTAAGSAPTAAAT